MDAGRRGKNRSEKITIKIFMGKFISWSEFKEFLGEYKILSVGIAFIMSQAINDFVKSFVDYIFMPFLDPLTPDEAWEAAVFHIGQIEISWGIFLSKFIYLALVSIIVFVFIRKILKTNNICNTKKASVKK